MPKLCPPARFDRIMDLLASEPEEGFVELLELAERYPKDPDVRRATGVELLDRDEPLEALDHLEAAAKRSQLPEFHMPVAAAYLNLGLFAHARRALKRAIDRGAAPIDDDLMDAGYLPDLPDREVMGLEAGLLDVYRGNVKAGLRRIRSFASNHPEQPGAWLVLASAGLEHGRIREARDAAQASLDLDPDSAKARLHLVHADLLLHGPEAAREHVRDLEPKDVGEALALARTHALLDDPAGVEPTLEKLRGLLEHEDDMPELAQELEDRIEGWRDFDGFGEPVLGLEDIAGFLIDEWLSRPPGPDGVDRIKARLLELPGLLELIPDRLGWENEGFANLVAASLATLDPDEDPMQPLRDVEKVALEGPGGWRTRTSLLKTLLHLEVVSPERVAQSDLGELVALEVLDVYDREDVDVVMDEEEAAELLPREHELEARVRDAQQALDRGDLEDARGLLAWPAELDSVSGEALGPYLAARIRLAAADDQIWLAFALADVAHGALDPVLQEAEHAEVYEALERATESYLERHQPVDGGQRGA